jgi:hypothetical protein
MAFNRMALSALCIALLSAACAGSSKPSAAPSSGAPSATTVAGATSVDQAVGLDKKGMLRRQLQIEGLLATCMKSKGFDYIPLDPSTTPLGNGGSSPVVIQGLNADEFRTQYGYGLTTLYDATVTPSTKGAVSNPNTKIRDNLGPADKAAYDKALTGGSSDGTFANAADQGDFSNLGGCNKEATIKVFGGTQALQTVQSALDEVDKRFAADKRIVTATRQWSTCMRDGGFDFANGDLIDGYLTTKLDAIVGPPAARKTSYDKAALAALQQLELKLAALDNTCDTKFLKPIADKVQAEVEKAILAAHPELGVLGSK